jgi:hypothetical protein
MTIATQHLAMTHLVPLAKELDENKVTPGVLGFIVFALLGGAVWMLMKSMNKQFQKIDFDEGGEGSEDGKDGGKREAVGGRPADAKQD